MQRCTDWKSWTRASTEVATISTQSAERWGVFWLFITCRFLAQRLKYDLFSCRWLTSGWVGALEEQRGLQLLNIANPTYETLLPNAIYETPSQSLCEASLPNPTCEAPLVTAPRGMPLVKVLAGEAWTSFIRQIRDKTMQKAVRKQEKGTHRRKVRENIKTL